MKDDELAEWLTLHWHEAQREASGNDPQVGRSLCKQAFTPSPIGRGYGQFAVSIGVGSSGGSA